jgi:hypothetical protein
VHAGIWVTICQADRTHPCAVLYMSVLRRPRCCRRSWAPGCGRRNPVSSSARRGWRRRSEWCLYAQGHALPARHPGSGKRGASCAKKRVIPSSRAMGQLAGVAKIETACHRLLRDPVVLVGGAPVCCFFHIWEFHGECADRLHRGERSPPHDRGQLPASGMSCRTKADVAAQRRAAGRSGWRGAQIHYAAFAIATTRSQVVAAILARVFMCRLHDHRLAHRRDADGSIQGFFLRPGAWGSSTSFLNASSALSQN